MEQFTAASLGVTPFYVENAMIHSISMENALIQIQTSPKKQAETGHLGLGIVFWIMIWLGHFIFSKFNPKNWKFPSEKILQAVVLIPGGKSHQRRLCCWGQNCALKPLWGGGNGKICSSLSQSRINIYQHMIYLHQNNDCTEQLLFGFERRGREKARSDQQPVSMELPSAGNRCNQVHHYQNLKKILSNVYICRGNWDAVGIVRRRKKCPKSKKKKTCLLFPSCNVCYQVYDVKCCVKIWLQ